MAIDRWEGLFLERCRSWLLVYGRRKTGKTFLLRRHVDYDVYVIVSRSGSECFVQERGGALERRSVDECLKEVRNALIAGGTVVIDEFQRMPRGMWDALALMRSDANGRLVLCGSSMGIVREVFDRRSPLLGLLLPFRVDLASPGDAIVSLAKQLKPREAVLWAVLARDPWILGVADARGDAVEAVRRLSVVLVDAAKGLVGEVFTEEERKLTRLYEAVLHLLADGYWSSKVLAQKLYEAGLLESPDPGVVTGILNQLEHMGLVEKVPLWRTRGARTYYKHRSSLLSLLLSIGGYVEALGLPSKEDVLVRIAIELQFFVGELLARSRGLLRAYTILPRGEGDIDVVLLDRRRKPVIAYEVKLGAFSQAEARRAVERIRGAGIPRAGLVSLEERPPGIADEALGPQEILGEAAKLSRTEREEAVKRAVSAA